MRIKSQRHPPRVSKRMPLLAYFATYMRHIRSQSTSPNTVAKAATKDRSNRNIRAIEWISISNDLIMACNFELFYEMFSYFMAYFSFQKTCEVQNVCHFHQKYFVEKPVTSHSSQILKYKAQCL